MSKITIATVKSFIKRNRAQLLVKVTSQFDGMQDMVVGIENAQFHPAMDNQIPDSKRSLGICGVNFTASTRNYCTAFSDGTYEGFSVSNCCGSWLVAVPVGTDKVKHVARGQVEKAKKPECKVPLDRIMEACEADDNMGFCMACGEEAHGVEPDAAGYPCECCGEPRVYGAEELLIRFVG